MPERPPDPNHSMWYRDQALAHGALTDYRDFSESLGDLNLDPLYFNGVGLVIGAGGVMPERVLFADPAQDYFALYPNSTVVANDRTDIVDGVEFTFITPGKKWTQPSQSSSQTLLMSM
jgi:hypothetical protein